MIYNISFYYVQMLKANSLSRWTLYLTQHNQTKAKLWHIQLWPFIFKMPLMRFKDVIIYQGKFNKDNLIR